MIYEEMLEKALGASASNSIWKQIIAITPESDAGYFERRRLKVMRQCGDDIGQRMSCALEQGFWQGAHQVILIGSDIPTLRSAEIMDAFSLLDSYPAVIGPAEDGGFYLIGVTAEYHVTVANILRGDVRWSTQQVLSEVQQLCARDSLPLACLPMKQDIDSYEDWLDYKSTQGVR